MFFETHCALYNYVTKTEGSKDKSIIYLLKVETRTQWQYCTSGIEQHAKTKYAQKFEHMHPNVTDVKCKTASCYAAKLRVSVNVI